MESKTIDLFYDRILDAGVTPDDIKQAGLFNAFEYALSKLPQANHGLKESILNDQGFYVRTAILPADTILISNRHGTWHPFIIRRGRGMVVEEINGEQTEMYEYIAGGVGEHEHFTKITRPGTRRIILVVEETEWTTFHATDKVDAQEVMTSILIPNDNPLLEHETNLIHTL